MWFEAEIENEMLFRFRAPNGSELKVGDVFAFDRCFLGREFSTMVYGFRENAKIRVDSRDVKDLRDRSILLELRFGASNTTVQLLKTLEVETRGPHPGGDSGGMARYDDIESYEYYLRKVAKPWMSDQFNAVGTLEMRESILHWTETVVVPELKKSRDKFGRGPGIT